MSKTAAPLTLNNDSYEVDAVKNLSTKQRTARLHNLLREAINSTPELATIEKKISQNYQDPPDNKDASEGYAIKLSSKKYMELFSATKQAIRADNSEQRTQIVDSLRQSINKSIPIHQRKQGKAVAAKPVATKIDVEVTQQPQPELQQATKEKLTTQPKQVQKATTQNSLAKKSTAKNLDTNSQILTDNLNSLIDEVEKHEQKVTGKGSNTNPQKLEHNLKSLIDEVEKHEQKATAKNIPIETVEVANAFRTAKEESLKKPINRAEQTEAPQIAAQQANMALNNAGDGVAFAADDQALKTARQEIITKQQQYLQQQLALNVTDKAVKDQINNDLKNYLNTPEGKQNLVEVLAQSATQAELTKLEIRGQQQLHTSMQGSYQPVNWQADTKNQTRTSEIKNAAGEVVTKLTEHNVATNQKITLADGTTQTLAAHREIDFPPSLESKKGPMHLSMVLKNADGQNMPQDQALYFSAHYDKTGKLQEVTAPAGIKFAGEQDNAIGYVEREGKIYSLPVTKAKYQQMMHEVQKNQGLNIDLQQQQKFSTQPRQATQEKPIANKIAPARSAEPGNPNHEVVARVTAVKEELGIATSSKPTIKVNKEAHIANKQFIKNAPPPPPKLPQNNNKGHGR